MPPLSNGYGRPGEEEGVKFEAGVKFEPTFHVYTHLLCSILLENEHPEAAGEEEEDGEHLIEGRQGHLPARKHDRGK